MSKADSDFRRFPDLSKNELVRQSLAEMNIISSRRCGLIISDEENYRRAGYSDSTEYWDIKLSECMEVNKFANSLSNYFIDPLPHAPGCSPQDTFRSLIKAAMKSALRSYEPWFVEASIGSNRNSENLAGIVLHPRAAAEWMLSKQKWRGFVPEGLREHLDATAPPKPKPLNPQRRRGPMGVKQERVKAAMINMPLDELKRMKEVEMEVTFEVSRYTARKVREEVLSEKDNSDN